MAAPETTSPGAPSTTILTAELLSVGTELTVGETRDTNAGDLARTLVGHGVTIRRIQVVPDDLAVVTEAFSAAAGRVDLVVSTGGLGPTPDDLTREALAAVLSETPEVDPALERWLRGLWARRGMPFPEINRKQAWLVPSATAIPNANGTAPGWWIDGPGAAVVVALPGPPREMRPMWDGWVLPRLIERGLGRPQSVRTLRLFGIGESHAADLLGAALLAAANPTVATYARAEAVDVRIAAVDSLDGSAEALADAAEAEVVRQLGEHIWARGSTTWPEAIDAELQRRGWSLATTEGATGGTLAALLAPTRGLRRAEILGDGGLAASDVEGAAERARTDAPAEVGVALRVQARGDDTAVTVAVATPDGTSTDERVAFLGGTQGRYRAALTAADILLRRLRSRSS